MPFTGRSFKSSVTYSNLNSNSFLQIMVIHCNSFLVPFRDDFVL